MELAAFVVYAVLVEKRPVREVAAAHGVSKTWLYEAPRPLPRGGLVALAPRSRWPRKPPARSPPGSSKRSSRSERRSSRRGSRRELPRSSPTSKRRHAGTAPCSTSTIWRVLRRRGFVTDQPREAAEELLRALGGRVAQRALADRHDPRHAALGAGGVGGGERHRRPLPPVRREAGSLPVTSPPPTSSGHLYEAAEKWGYSPASVLSDNGRILPTNRHQAAATGGRSTTELRTPRHRHSSTPGPTIPRPAGKVERFHQTMKKHLDWSQGAPGSGIAELQARIEGLRRLLQPHPAPPRNQAGLPLQAAFQSPRRERPPTGCGGAQRRRVPRSDTTRRRPTARGHPAHARQTGATSCVGAAATHGPVNALPRRRPKSARPVSTRRRTQNYSADLPDRPGPQPTKPDSPRP